MTEHFLIFLFPTYRDLKFGGLVTYLETICKPLLRVKGLASPHEKEFRKNTVRSVTLDRMTEAYVAQ